MRSKPLGGVLIGGLLVSCGEDGQSSLDAACAHDCAGVCGGSATLDACGVCDTDPSNDCWRGVHGTANLAEFPQQPNLGSGRLAYSVNDGPTQRGYFYLNNPFADPPVSVSGLEPTNACNTSSYPGYTGLSTVQELRDASSLSYGDSEVPVLFGTEASSCHSGLLVFRQGGRYGVIRFIVINPDDSVSVEYWIGEADVVDFRNAPAP
jgi:hypothetical protein